MTNWFTSDLHLGHARIVELSHRPFATIEEHDETIADNWRRVVRPDDIVWLLGDASSEGTWQHALDIIRELPGRKMLITGNHDRCWPQRRNAHKFFAPYSQVFELVSPWARTSVLGTRVWLSHFPYVGDHTETDRFPECRLPISATPLVHGHIHSETQKVSRVPLMVNNELVQTTQVHVGVDAWDFNLVPDTTVKSLVTSSA